MGDAERKKEMVASRSLAYDAAFAGKKAEMKNKEERMMTVEDIIADPLDAQRSLFGSGIAHSGPINDPLEFLYYLWLF